jgi:pilus assembly protein CpaB
MQNKAMSLALIIAGFATFLVWSYVDEAEQKARSRYGSQIIVMKAKRDINEADMIDESMIEKETIPEAFKEPSALFFDVNMSEEEQKKSLRGVEGTVATVPIKKGEQITRNKISEMGARTGLAPQVSPGRRAMAVQVNDQSGVSKLLKPGDRIDLIAVIDKGGGDKKNKVAKTLFQDVVVLSVGKNVTNNIAALQEKQGSKMVVRSLNEDLNYSTVTIELDPVQVQTLALVISQGENALMFSLRNNDDTERLNLGNTVIEDILTTDNSRMRVPAGGGR